jgi:tRNA modification GTPase
VIDEVLAAYMRAPRTYTREDVMEIHTHGGPLLLRRVLDLVLASGARAANPGEMTLRAFLNGRLDLAQAEAVMSLINAETDAGRRLAMRQLQGELSERVEAIRATIMAAVARIEASIDFPEEEVPEPDIAELRDLTRRALADAQRLLATAGRGRAVREGIRIAIVGRPNVGKSSLLNALLRVNRAIVTAIAGTTRDTVEERAVLGGMAVHLIDTAGLTTTDDPVERAGVERSREAARSADLLLLVLDSSEPLNDMDREAADELERLVGENDLTHAPVVAVLNKSDLPSVLYEREAATLPRVSRVIHASAVTPDGVAALEHVIAELIVGGEAQAGDVAIASARHEDALRRTEDSLGEVEHGLDERVPLDLISIDLREALAALGEITGETATEDILDRIFSEFCIGK